MGRGFSGFLGQTRINTGLAGIFAMGLKRGYGVFNPVLGFQMGRPAPDSQRMKRAWTVVLVAALATPGLVRVLPAGLGKRVNFD